MRRLTAVALALAMVAVALVVPVQGGVITNVLYMYSIDPMTPGQFFPAISSASVNFDGSLVAFVADAGLLPDGQPGEVYLFHRLTGVTGRVPMLPGLPYGGQPRLSGDGRWLAYLASTTPVSFWEEVEGQVVLRDLGTDDAWVLGSAARQLAISASGGSVAFVSLTSLLPVDSTAYSPDVYLYDMGTLRCVTAGLSAQGWSNYSSPSLSGDGSLLAFTATSRAYPTSVFLYSRASGSCSRLDFGYMLSTVTDCALSADGRTLALIGPSWPGYEYVWCYDRSTRSLTRLGRAQTGIGLGGMVPRLSISSDGNMIATASTPTANFEHPIRVWDRAEGTSQLVGIDPESGLLPYPMSFCPALSGDGRWVCFDNLYWADTPTAWYSVYLARVTPSPPEVVTTMPADGATDVAATTPVTADFTRPLDPTTISTVTVGLYGPGGAVTGTLRLDCAGQRLIFTPSALLAPGTYTLTIQGGAGGVADTAGVPLAEDFTATFAVGDEVPFVVVSTDPPDGAQHVSPTTTISATFNAAVDLATLTRDTFQAFSTYSSEPLPATISYDPGTFTATLTPDAAIPEDFVLVQLGDVRSATGQPLSGNTSWSFSTRTDTTPPVVTITSPVEGATVRPGAKVEVTVNDQSPILSVEVWLGNTLVQSLTPIGFPDITLSARDLRPFDGQTLALRVVMTDDLGNQGEDSVSVTVQANSFDDVPVTSPWWPFVEALAREGIASGCSRVPPLFCPGAVVTRGQLAVWVCRAAGWSPLASGTPAFADVPTTSPYYGYIERLYAQRVIAGCATNPLRFCPNAPVTRLQAAVVLCRAAGIAPCDKPTPTFADVPRTNPAYGYVEALYAHGAVSGCATGPLRFCPTAPVTRGPMASMLCRALYVVWW